MAEHRAETWPPPPSPGDWRLERFPVDAEGRVAPRGEIQDVRVRNVQLWGRQVLINEAGEVFCDDCWRFLPVEVLGAPYNTHRAGLTGRFAGRVLHVADDDEGPAAPRWATEGL